MTIRAQELLLAYQPDPRQGGAMRIVEFTAVEVRDGKLVDVGRIAFDVEKLIDAYESMDGDAVTEVRYLVGRDVATRIVRGQLKHVLASINRVFSDERTPLGMPPRRLSTNSGRE